MELQVKSELLGVKRERGISGGLWGTVADSDSDADSPPAKRRADSDEGQTANRTAKRPRTTPSKGKGCCDLCKEPNTGAGHAYAHAFT